MRFGIIGVCATGVYYVTALLGLRAQLTVEISHVLAFAVSIVVSYLGQKMFTFRVRGEHRRSAWRFAIATGVIAGTQFLVVLGLQKLALDPAVLFAISSVYYPIASFFVHSFWTFRSKSGVAKPS